MLILGTGIGRVAARFTLERRDLGRKDYPCKTGFSSDEVIEGSSIAKRNRDSYIPINRDVSRVAMRAV